MIKDLCDILSALAQYFKQTHLCAHNRAYSAHLLTEKLLDKTNERIDRLKELYIVSTGDYSIANAQESLSEAIKKLRIVLDNTEQDTTNEMLKVCIKLEQWALEEANRASNYYSEQAQISYATALINALDDISEGIAREIYLLNTEVDND